MTVVDRLNGVNSALAIKAPVRVATTANITLSGLQTIDGVTVAAGDRVLVKDQTTASENGIYDVASTAWTRAKDFDGPRDVAQYTRVLVGSGTNYAGREFQVTTANPITVGTTSLAFAVTDNTSAISTRDFIDVAGVAPSAPSSGRYRIYFDDGEMKVAVPSGVEGGPFHIPTYTTGSITVSTTDDWLDIITRHEGGSYIYFEDGEYDFYSTKTITAAAWAGGTATLTFSGYNSGLHLGDTITVAGVNPTGYNGSFVVTGLTANTVSYAKASDPGATVSVAGATVSRPLSSGWSPESTNVLLRAQNVGGATFKNMRITMRSKYMLLWGFDILPPDDGAYWFSIGWGGLECFDCCMDISAFTNQTSGIGFTTMADFKVRSITRDSIWNFGNRVTAQAFDIDSSSSVKHGWTQVSKATTGGSWASSSPAVTGATFSKLTGKATLTHAGGTLLVGSSITVAGMNPALYDGTFVVTESSNGSVSYELPGVSPTATTTFVAGGTVTFGTATITHAGSLHAPIVGSPITISGVTPSGYNGTHTVTASQNGQVSFQLLSNPGAYSAHGTISLQSKNSFITTNDITQYIIDTSLGIITGTELVNDIPDPATKTITSGTWSGGTTTLIHSGTNSFPVGSFITVAGAADSDYNGTFQVTASSAGSVSYADSNPGTSPIGGGGTIVAIPCGNGLITRRSAAIVLANYCRIAQFDVGLRPTLGDSVLYSDTSIFAKNTEAVYDDGGVMILTDTNTFVDNTIPITVYGDRESSGLMKLTAGPLITNGLGIGMTRKPNADLEIANTTRQTCTFTATIDNGAGSTGNILTVSAIASGSLAVGDRIWGTTITGVGFNTVIMYKITVNPDGTGTYAVNNAALVGSSTMYAVDGGKAVIRITNTETASAIAQLIGAIEMWGSDGSTAGAGVKGYIAVVSETVGSDAHMIFGVADNVSTQQAVERFRLMPEGVRVTGGLMLGAPVTTTSAAHTLASTTNHLICNRAGTVTVTLPDATATNNIGRIITIKTVTANTVISASSNVVPIDGTVAGTAILAATAGKWARLISNGTNWVIMEAN